MIPSTSLLDSIAALEERGDKAFLRDLEALERDVKALSQERPRPPSRVVAVRTAELLSRAVALLAGMTEAAEKQRRKVVRRNLRLEDELAKTKSAAQPYVDDLAHRGGKKEVPPGLEKMEEHPAGRYVLDLLRGGAER